MGKKMQFAACLTMFVITVGLTFAVGRRSPLEQSAAAAEGTFPRLRASNLEGKTLQLPEDFAGDRNLLLIAFQREQQKNVDTWLREMTRFEISPGFHYYELPTLGKMSPVVRWFIDNGMRRGISDRNARSRTVTLYLDKPSFRKSLRLPDETRIYTILIDHLGNVVWRAEGDFDEAKGSSLLKALSQGKQ